MPDNTIENFADLVAEVDTLRTNTEANFVQVNQNLVAFIDTARLLHTITTYNATWTATEDCYVDVLISTSNSGEGASVYLNDVELLSSAATVSIRSGFYCKKGQTIKTKNIPSGRYAIKTYGLQK